jgi:hypothetical protein
MIAIIVIGTITTAEIATIMSGIAIPSAIIGIMTATTGARMR